MSHFSVDVFTPSKVVERNIPAEYLSIPTCKGEIQILPEHTHLITKLDVGVLRLRQKDQEKSYLVTRGICKILGNKVLILAKSAEKVEDINEEQARMGLQKAQEALNYGLSSSSPEEFENLQTKLREAQIKLQILAKNK